MKIATKLGLSQELILEGLTSAIDSECENLLIAASPASLERWLEIAEALEVSHCGTTSATSRRELNYPARRRHSRSSGHPELEAQRRQSNYWHRGQGYRPWNWREGRNDRPGIHLPPTRSQTASLAAVQDHEGESPASIRRPERSDGRLLSLHVLLRDRVDGVNFKLLFVLDSGSEINILPRHLLPAEFMTLIKEPKLKSLKLVSHCIVIVGEIELNTTIGAKSLNLLFHIVQSGSLNFGILSAKYLLYFKVKIDFNNNYIKQNNKKLGQFNYSFLDRELEAIQRFYKIQNYYAKISRTKYCNHHVNCLKVNRKCLRIRDSSFYRNVANLLEDDVCNFVCSVLDSGAVPYVLKSKPGYQPDAKPLPLPDTNDCYLHDNIELFTMPPRLRLSDKKPVCVRPYRHRLRDRDLIKQQIEQLLKYGLIKPAYSPYSAPVTLAPKKGEGRIRLCIDYRLLNRKIISDSFPIPLMEDIVQ
ncbi:hypothetical protein LAZ67_13000748 [Cordylochernes scorpioides]|uniref:Uncharacterized protein n=1 Tax=Cordylochernes scorpioides TaxID=51811 RepID=A0ABY6L393_9ARAC|nr:hypothetical protein LAZ67_13000748 [Cordylochernes scorpioides]